jgi:hypothetical protein
MAPSKKTYPKYKEVFKRSSKLNQYIKMEHNPIIEQLLKLKLDMKKLYETTIMIYKMDRRLKIAKEQLLIISP